MTSIRMFDQNRMLECLRYTAVSNNVGEEWNTIKTVVENVKMETIGRRYNTKRN